MSDERRPGETGDAPSTWGSSRDDATIPPPGHDAGGGWGAPAGGGWGAPAGGPASPPDATVPPPGSGSGGPRVWRTPSSDPSTGSGPVGAGGVAAPAHPPAPPQQPRRGLAVALGALAVALLVLLGAIMWQLLRDDGGAGGTSHGAGGTSYGTDGTSLGAEETSGTGDAGQREPAVPFVDYSPSDPLPAELQAHAEGLYSTRKDDAQDSATAQEVNMRVIQTLADAARSARPGDPYPETLDVTVPNQQARYTCRHVGDDRYSAWDCRTTNIVAGTPGFQVISVLNSQGLPHSTGTIGDPDWRTSILDYAGRGRR